MYAERRCVCGWCWSALVVLYDGESSRWVASCPTCDEVPTVYHHRAWVETTIAQSKMDALEVIDFYRRTEFAEQVGLTPFVRESPEQVLTRNRKILRGDGSGLD